MGVCEQTSLFSCLALPDACTQHIMGSNPLWICIWVCPLIFWGVVLNQFDLSKIKIHAVVFLKIQFYTDFDFIVR